MTSLLLLLLTLQNSAQTDSLLRIRGGSLELKVRVFHSANRTGAPVLLVVLHGDAPREKPSYQNHFAMLAAKAADDVVAVGLLRPGYTDPDGNVSDGVRGETTGDNYNATNTDAIAGAIRELKRRYHARRVVVAGHSGGAAITANILGRHPDLIDAALLVSCPCDVTAWRAHMLEKTKYDGFKGKISTLSPIDLVGGVSKKADIVMMVGEQDDVAPPALSEAYRAAVAARGGHIRLARVPEQEHNIFMISAVKSELVALLRNPGSP